MIRISVCFLFFCSLQAYAQTLSFEQALRAILSKDTAIAIADASKRATEGQNIYRRFHLFPQISLEGSEGRTNPNVHTTSLYGTANFSLFHFGADHAALQSARASEKAADFKLQQTRLESETNAVEKLVAFVRLQFENSILTQLEQMESESLETAKRQFNGGRVPLQEVQKVEIDLQNVRSRIGESSIRNDQAKADLMRLLGHSDVRVEWPWKDRIKAWTPQSLNAEDYFSVRPDFQTATQQVEAQSQLKKQAFRSLLPEVAARLTYGWGRDAVDPNLFNTGWSGVLLLEIPLFSRFRDYSNYQYQAATLEVAEASQVDLGRKVRAEFENVPKQFQAAQKTAVARDQILQMSTRLYQDNLARFKLGKASSNELNIDLNRYLETELNAISGWALAHTTYVSLIHLTGKSILTQASSSILSSTRDFPPSTK